MRSLSTATLAELFANETPQAWLWLLSIYTPEVEGGVIRIVNNMQNVVSRGMTFTAYPFRVVLPSDSEENQPGLQLQIDNVELMLVTLLRQMLVPPTCVLELIAMTRADSPEFAVQDLVLRTVEWDSKVVTFNLTHEDVMHAKFPAHTYNPEEFPGIF